MPLSRRSVSAADGWQGPQQHHQRLRKAMKKSGTHHSFPHVKRITATNHSPPVCKAPVIPFLDLRLSIVCSKAGCYLRWHMLVECLQSPVRLSACLGIAYRRSWSGLVTALIQSLHTHQSSPNPNSFAVVRYRCRSEQPCFLQPMPVAILQCLLHFDEVGSAPQIPIYTRLNSARHANSMHCKADFDESTGPVSAGRGMGGMCCRHAAPSPSSQKPYGRTNNPCDTICTSFKGSIK